MNFKIVLVFIALYFVTLSQFTGERILFQVTMNCQALEIDSSYFVEELNDSIHIDALKFYISDVQLWQDDELVFTLEKKHHLIDLENEASLNIDFNTTATLDCNTIRFNLGVDSLTNSNGAFGGDLDPTNGMYWTWQSGYINFKLEGSSPSCPARKNVFQYHLGGFLGANNALQKVSLPLSGNTKVIELPLDDFFRKVNLKEEYQVMSPSPDAVEFSETVAGLFKTRIDE